MKLEVGQFVRFKDKRGNEYIRKIVEMPEDNRYASLYLDKDANYSKGLSIKNVIKASYNIIDILKVGDIITTNNLCGEITKIDRDKIYTTCYDGEYCYVDDIKSVVTKEQMEQMSYKVGSDK